MPAWTSAQGNMFYKSTKPFSKECEYKLLYLFTWNTKNNLKIIQLVFDPGLTVESLP